MSMDANPDSTALAATAGPVAGGLFRRRMLALLGRLEGCEIVLEEAGERLRLGRPVAGTENLRVTLVVHDAAM